MKHSDKSGWILAITDIRNISTVIGSENWAKHSSKNGQIPKHLSEMFLIRRLKNREKTTQLLVM
jgi:hypothetical protein